MDGAVGGARKSRRRPRAASGSAFSIAIPSRPDAVAVVARDRQHRARRTTKLTMEARTGQSCIAVATRPDFVCGTCQLSGPRRTVTLRLRNPQVTSPGEIDVQLFISHRRNDAPGHTGRSSDELCDHYGSNNVFFDLDSIDAGENFAARIEAVVNASDVALVVIGSTWVTAEDSDGARRLDDPKDWVRTEVSAALGSHSLVIPVLVGGAAMPSSDALPDDIRSLSLLNAFRLRDETWRQDARQLISTIDATARRQPRHRRRRRTRLTVAAVAVAAVLFVGGGLMYAQQVEQRGPEYVLEALVAEKQTDGPAGEDVKTLNHEMGQRVEIRAFLTKGTAAEVSLYLDDVAIYDGLVVDESEDVLDKRPGEGFYRHDGIPFRFGVVLRLVVEHCERSAPNDTCVVVVQFRARP